MAAPQSIGFETGRWLSRPLSTSTIDARKGTFTSSSVVLSGPSERELVFKRAAIALSRYEVFPPTRMQHCVCTPDRRIAPGATIIQRVRLGPMRLESAVRIVDVFDAVTATERRIGFSYATLAGHPERGIATFFVREELPSGPVSLVIETWSRPGTWLTKLVKPVARMIQKRLTGEALKHFQALATRA